MKLLLLFTISTLIVDSINAVILLESQDITNDLERQIVEAPHKRSDRLAQSLAAAVEYLRAPELPRRSSNTKVGNPLDAAAEYFKAPDLPNHHKTVDRVAEGLAAAAEYLKAPELPKYSSSTKVGNSLDAAAEYFKAPESPKFNIRTVRATKNLVAAAEFRASDVRRKIAASRRRMFGTTTEASLRYY